MTTDHAERPHSPLRAWAGVAAITASLFVFLTTELMPVGILTPLSRDLRVAPGVAALMVTGQGVAAGLGVAFIVAWTRRVDRRVLLSVLLAVLAAGNLVVSVSPSFALILVTRVCMGFASGVFWAIGVSMAMRIVGERHASRAAAVVMSGIAIATVVGIPLGTYLESLTDWRATFLIWAGLSGLVFVTVAAVLPSLPSTNAVSVREVFRLPVVDVPLRLVLIAIVLFVLGHFGAYTFVRPFLEQHTSAGPGFVTVSLMVFGVAGAAGNFAAGRGSQRSPRTGFTIGCAGLVAAMLLLLAIGDGRTGALIALVVWGLSFGVVQLSQVNMTLAAAPQAFEAAMSLNTMAYNTCIALGALFGGLVQDGLGPTRVVWFGVLLTAAALLFTLAVAARGQAGRARARRQSRARGTMNRV